MRSASLDGKWHQYNTLVAMDSQFSDEDPQRDGEPEVRQRWARLRKAHLEKRIAPN